jgi:hypothetical protein
MPWARPLTGPRAEFADGARRRNRQIATGDAAASRKSAEERLGGPTAPAVSGGLWATKLCEAFGGEGGSRNGAIPGGRSKTYRDAVIAIPRTRTPGVRWAAYGAEPGGILQGPHQRAGTPSDGRPPQSPLPSCLSASPHQRG